MTDAAAPLCIDCGKNPQPARHDGEPGTHHRCDPCARVYLRRRELRRRLLGGRWTFFALPEPIRCTQCGSEIDAEVLLFRLGATDTGDTCCLDCADACGWRSALLESAPEAPVLLSAAVGFHVYDGPLFVVFRVPAAQPAIAASAVHLLGALADSDVQGGIGAGDPALGGLSGLVFARPDDADAARVAGVIAGWLTEHARRVTVPRPWYRRIREIVYDDCGSGSARRLDPVLGVR